MRGLTSLVGLAVSTSNFSFEGRNFKLKFEFFYNLVRFA